jgi:hypothetical protein
MEKENNKASAGDPVWFVGTFILLGLIAALHLEILLYFRVRDYSRSYPNMALQLFVDLFWLKNLAAGLSFFSSKRTGDVAGWIGLMLHMFGFLALYTVALACWLAKLN